MTDTDPTPAAVPTPAPDPAPAENSDSRWTAFDERLKALETRTLDNPPQASEPDPTPDPTPEPDPEPERVPHRSHPLFWRPGRRD